MGLIDRETDWGPSCILRNLASKRIRLTGIERWFDFDKFLIFSH